MPFRQNINTSRRALSCDWVNIWASIRIISSACFNLINSINKQKSFINTTNFTNKHLGKYYNDFHRPAAVLNQKCELPLAAGNEDFNFNVEALQTKNNKSFINTRNRTNNSQSLINIKNRKQKNFINTRNSINKQTTKFHLHKKRTKN